MSPSGRVAITRSPQHVYIAGASSPLLILSEKDGQGQVPAGSAEKQKANRDELHIPSYVSGLSVFQSSSVVGSINTLALFFDGAVLPTDARIKQGVDYAQSKDIIEVR